MHKETKHDLKVRPIWHWNENRIRIAIAFMACVRHLAYRVTTQKKRMSPEVIRSALVHRQCSVLSCRQSGNRYVIPSKPTPAADLRNHGATPDDHPVPARLSADKRRPDSKKCRMLCLDRNENQAISVESGGDAPCLRLGEWRLSGGFRAASVPQSHP